MAFESTNIAIVILAAGASKRMGTPKQLLSWDNTTLIEHVIQTAVSVSAKEVVVVLGANHNVLSDKIKHYPITLLYNDDWKLGLGSSIATAVNYFKKLMPNIDGLLFMLADQPFIVSDYLKAMIQSFFVDDKQILATSYDDGKYGVPVLFDNFYFNELSKLNDDHGAKLLLKKYKSHVTALTPPKLNVDLDTLEDYRKYIDD